MTFVHVQRSCYIPSDNSLADARVAYLLLKDAPNPPPAISLPDSLAGTGVYLFIPSLPEGAALEPFIDQARTYLNAPARAGVRFAWIADPNATGSDFAAVTLVLDGVTTRESFFLSLTANVAVRLSGGTRVSVSGEGALRFTSPADSPSVLYVTPPGGQDPQTLPIAGPIGLPMLGAGATNGCLTFAADVGGEWLAYLDIGLRLFYADPYWGTVGSYRYPMFDEATARFTLQATADPLAPADSDRTYFCFGQERAIATYYRTNLGHSVALTPADGARLTFARRSNGEKEHYLTVQGDFVVAVTTPNDGVGAPDKPHLMCGLSGVEYLQLEPDLQTRLTFVAGQAAFVQGFTPGQEPPAGVQPTLTSDFTTAWVYPHRVPEGSDPGLVTYCAQPDDAVLHTHANGEFAGLDPSDPTQIISGALSYMEVPSSFLPARASLSADEVPQAFPMLPYGKAQDDVDAMTQLERLVVNPTRKAVVDQLAVKTPAALPPRWAPRSAATADAPNQGATPQGLLASYAPDFSTLQEITLALTDPPAGQPDGSRLSLVAVDRGSDLWQALGTNQLFLVVTDPAALDEHLTGLLRMQGWQFSLDPKQWRSDTVLIFKFYKDPTKTLQDLVRATDSWTMGKAFNGGDTAKAAKRIARAFDHAKQQCCGAGGDCLESGACPGSPDYSSFIYQVMLDPRWNGILALNVPVSPDDLPDELKVLAAGIELGNFYAHHLGVNATPVERDPQTGAFALKPSSVFGLIDYTDTAPPPAGRDYSFKVEVLRVLFQNSAIAAFTSKVALQVGSLFTEKVTLHGASDNIVHFNGIYQEHNGQPAYIFTTGSSSRFIPTGSKVLAHVTFDKGQFITVTPDRGSVVQSRFVFWGSLGFHALTGLDLFSFGPDAGQQQGGLAFANLAIDMAFDPANPTSQQFGFDTSHLNFDIATSSARAGSLFSHFPLKLTGFATSTTGAAPTDQGYMSVSSPVSVGTLAAPWYGLAFELNLGSLGALAEKAGFVATLLAAWSPGDGDGAAVFVGLRLPNASGGERAIVLQSLLKIKIKNILLLGVPGQSHQGLPTVSYLLRLQTITLSFMGLPFPWKGRTDFLLFGDPNASGDNKRLGWYAVYDEGVKSKPKKPIKIPGFDQFTSPNGGPGA